MDRGLIELIRSLGYGALFGAGVLGLVYALFVDRFYPVVSLRDVVLIGALIGAGLHKAIDTYLIKGLFHPVGSFVAYYGKLIQLIGLRRAGLISNRHATQLLRQLTDGYFLSDNEAKQKQLPPAKE